MDNYEKKKRAAAIAVAYYIQELNKKPQQSRWTDHGKITMMDNRRNLQLRRFNKRA